jgi:hypothetical protein
MYLVPSSVLLLLLQLRLLRIWVSPSDQALQTLFPSLPPITRAVTVTTGPITVTLNGIVPTAVVITTAPTIVATEER